MKATTVGIIGDFNPANSTHLFTNNAIQHAAQILGKSIDTVWLPTDKPVQYNDFQGLFGSPGSPYRSFAGALSGICYAREHKIPFIGTCGGFQHLLIEYARNVMGMKDAAHAESNPYAPCLFVTPLICSLVGKRMDVMLKPGSKAAFACQAMRSTESYYCNFGLNPAYQERLELAGLEITGRDESGEVRIAELPDHPFFLGTLFVPQANSTAGNPHALILEFCRSAVSCGRERFEYANSDAKGSGAPTHFSSRRSS